ncbi:DNA topoisomerase III [Jeotgalibaca ciconiae]|uniref:DNA topoisomerase 3 n=1 Tax=Jeotgalibaca ciconiae TaxID=2496265 RepID=A0A3Q9BJV4_9LACT|nr:DNA topoisomerase III [Jeotgalibaca ciconiae]AZP03962.1 DNA topoisomerase III [Jeotgalibaca ciconiae]HJB23452.1 DNA topoisomerase III [Candidatus Jeotgalibaca pullicola]
MGKSLVLAEKPSVARDIAKVLNCNKKGQGYIEGNQYVVTWALGHLVTLAEPEQYDNKYKTWNLNDLPMLPKDLKLTVIRQTSSQFQAVKKQMLRKDIDDIIIATDAGREGELVARWIIEKANVHKPMKRLWISSVTDKAIKDGFNKLKPGKTYENLYQSAVARSEADWYIGLNATRALTTKYNAQLNTGRVQTPVVAMIAKREEEIKNFQPKSYYGIELITENDMKLIWQDKQSGQTRSFDREKIQQLVKKLNQKSVDVSSVNRKQKKTYPSGLYDLTELQRDANRFFGYSAKETLNLMQNLYERHKVLTYPRTDSRYLSTDIVSTIPDRLRAIASPQYRSLVAKVTSRPIKANKSFVDDSKVSDHHAIIPTEQSIPLQKLSDRERKIYDLVVKRFLAVLFPAEVWEQVTLEAELNGERFVARGKTILEAGWREVYDNQLDEIDEEDDLKEQILPQLKKGDQLTISYVSETSGQTKPPAAFTEATLLSAMENPAKYMDSNDKKITQTLKETGGLGTVATRADIIDKLFSSFMLEKRGTRIHTTGKGRQLLELVPAELKSAELTGEWELKLEQIAKGKLKKEHFINEMKEYTKEIVSEIKRSDTQFKHDNLTTKHCPDCGKPMLEVNGKRGKMLVCQDRECGYRKNVSKVTNARCPVCHKKLELVGEGDGQMFVCKCGHREKLSAFQERRKKTGGKKADKRDVQKYLKSQQKEEPVNNAMFEALKGLKLDK